MFLISLISFSFAAPKTDTPVDCSVTYQVVISTVTTDPVTSTICSGEVIEYGVPRGLNLFVTVYEVTYTNPGVITLTEDVTLNFHTDSAIKRGDSFSLYQEATNSPYITIQFK